MSFNKCPICQKWDVGQHRCPPSFIVWCEDQGETEEDGITIYAYDHESAAEEFADQYDVETADYSIAAQKWEPTFTVKGLRDGGVKRFIVTGETVPSYSATETE